MNKKGYWLAALSALAALGVGAWFWWQLSTSQALKPAPAANATPPVGVPAPPLAPPALPVVPPILHPVAPAPAAELPALEESDAHVMAALATLLGRVDVLKMLQTSGFVRRVVATVDNLGRRHAAPALWPVNPTPGRFAVDDKGAVYAGNFERYTPFVLFVESVDSARAAALYVQLYPLFQRAYVELGYPDAYFNDRLVAVIDLLLETPVPLAPLKVELTEIKGEYKSERPWVRYRFSDPALNALSSGQRMLLRMGPVNERRLKTKLAEIRRLVATGAVAKQP